MVFRDERPRGILPSVIWKSENIAQALSSVQVWKFGSQPNNDYFDLK